MEGLQVSCPAAKQLLAELSYNPRYTFDPERPAQYEGSAAGMAMIESPSGYRAELRQRLADSGLAELLPGGVDLLPDIFEARGLLKSLSTWLKPRSYRQLAQHLTRFLDWYIHPGKQVPAATVALEVLQTPWFGWGMVFMVVLMQFVFGTLLTAYSSGGGAASCIGVFMVLYSALFYGTIAVLVFSQRLGKAQHHMIHREELFLYLRRAYADPPDAASELPERTAGAAMGLEASLGRQAEAAELLPDAPAKRQSVPS
jgi:hypothetical protein